MSYPSDWYPEDGNNSLPLVTFYPKSVGYAMVAVFVEDVSAPERSKDIKGYLNESIASYLYDPENFRNFKVISSKTNSFLDNKPAYTLEGSIS